MSQKPLFEKDKRTSKLTIMMNDSVKQKAKIIAKKKHTNISSLINIYIENYVKDNSQLVFED